MYTTIMIHWHSVSIHHAIILYKILMRKLADWSRMAVKTVVTVLCILAVIISAAVVGMTTEKGDCPPWVNTSEPHYCACVTAVDYLVLHSVWSGESNNLSQAGFMYVLQLWHFRCGGCTVSIILSQKRNKRQPYSSSQTHHRVKQVCLWKLE